MGQLNMPTTGISYLDCDWKEEEEENLSNFISRHEIGLQVQRSSTIILPPRWSPHRFLRLDPKLLLQGRQHGWKIGVLHPLKQIRCSVGLAKTYLWISHIPLRQTQSNNVFENRLWESFSYFEMAYIDNADDAIEEHINFLTRKYLHEVWPLR